MKKLIVARHGTAVPDDDHNGVLTGEGQEQVAQLARDLSLHIIGSVTILASASRRGRGSAEILVEVLHCPVTFDNMLWADNYHRGGSFQQIKELVEKHMDSVDTLIIVGHQDHGGYLVEYLGDEVFHVHVTASREVWCGSACVLDLNAKSCKFI
ncbi:hypothetical protein A3D66_00065 [Candidatus Kaiserbacteria bacterium RIFCSPHIGHO2_02_FULL_50_9]|uniref:Phosphohistidine phosphatase SixA n=1 Tax=Candidatus Kaiserbacteria bacterium RIFCSPLOWO2_01_FULL_51_21 TaxID=1798508 RepID=A0A1F6EEG9_9BACT|nr:MAG: hypothetical protein A2761_00250 [Candidatus Kaiserbacteria bacterium RIFCSPHIGHO2_01_FULL_51_33]OGG63709.1 MAG: hypothetical protein A3D66_00065 [Candidatus Kaiserbacteria bacterium RIFCSPHIGHO2_02_FULL_50_9]OGG72055.1 MAG: hypothetical protein A3A35_00885 [Candidatus Kaiserbacteria bacterium RIFCSPLOWO2_01_FULL_51_21]